MSEDNQTSLSERVIAGMVLVVLATPIAGVALVVTFLLWSLAPNGVLEHDTKMLGKAIQEAIDDEGRLPGIEASSCGVYRVGERVLIGSACVRDAWIHEDLEQWSVTLYFIEPQGLIGQADCEVSYSSQEVVSWSSPDGDRRCPSG